MNSIYSTIAFWGWPVLAAVWFLYYFTNKRTVKRPQIGKYLLTTILIAIGFFFLATNFTSGFLAQPLTPQNTILGVIGAAVAIAGILFAIWARVTIGKNWSGTVATIKEDHELVITGPYTFVRHPIYTGFFFGMLGTALTLGTLSSYVGVLCGLVAFLIRIKTEEGIMTQEFPTAYPEYKKRTKTLVPFVW